MRQIVLDTETTGLDWRNGDRVIEIGCVELLNRNLTGKHYHVYINPERGIDAEAVNVHGITEEFLADKPKFRDIARDFVRFVQDAELIIHNASFDVGFLNHELSLLQLPRLDAICSGVIDTLKMAKEQNPGKKASLDALCDRHGIDNGSRTLHGALLDAELLADVYLAMTRGQESLIMTLEEAPAVFGGADEAGALHERPTLVVLRPSDEEIAEHERVLQDISKSTKGLCLWMPPAEPVEAGPPA